MIHIDELTERDRCCYRRGEMREYVRNHNPVPDDLRHELYLWVCSGHSVHENPWGLMDWRTGLQHDYLAATWVFRAVFHHLSGDWKSPFRINGNHRSGRGNRDSSSYNRAIHRKM